MISGESIPDQTPGRPSLLCYLESFARFADGAEAFPLAVRGVGHRNVKPKTNRNSGNSGVYIQDRYEVQIIEPSRFDDANGATKPKGTGG